MDWSPQQDQALVGVKRWMDGGGQGTYRLFGYAGSGKTTLAREFASGVEGTVIFAAYTGKATHVLRKKGCPLAQTIHSLIYKPKEKSRERLKELQKALDDIEAALKQRGLPPEAYKTDFQWKKVHEDFEFEKSQCRRPMFALNEESAIKGCKLLVIDEVSMVDRQMGEDLESFGVPLLVLGDPAQLPPVRGSGYFTDCKPDLLLTEIHRQAKGNPILEMAHRVRQGLGLRIGEYGTSRVIPRSQVCKEDVMAADQVLVGLNKTRHGTNARMRELLHHEGPMPVVNDKLVCLRNHGELGLLNGGLWRTQVAVQSDTDSVELVLKEEDSELEVQTTAHAAYFLGNEPPFWDIKEKDCFDFGYALTTHKAQGSQWDKCYIFDESRVFRQDARKWLYTALTRAAESATVVVD